MRRSPDYNNHVSNALLLLHLVIDKRPKTTS